MVMFSLASWLHFLCLWYKKVGLAGEIRKSYELHRANNIILSTLLHTYIILVILQALDEMYVSTKFSTRYLH